MPKATDLANCVDFVARIRDVVDFGEQRELVDRLSASGECMHGWVVRQLTAAT